MASELRRRPHERVVGAAVADDAAVPSATSVGAAGVDAGADVDATGLDAGADVGVTGVDAADVVGGVVAGGAGPADSAPVRIVAFEAGAVAGAAASGYGLLLVLLRTTGAARVTGSTIALLLLTALLLAAREPAAVAAAVRRRQDGVVLAGLALGAALAAVGANGRLLFLPALLTIAALGALTGPRRAFVAAAFATAGLLLPLLTDPAAVSDRRLLALTALALLIVPPTLAALVAHLAAASPTPPPPPTPSLLPTRDPITVNLRVQETRNFTVIDEKAPATTPCPRLTPRQREAVALAARGLRHAEIAERLGISIHQVRRLLRQGRERVHARTTRELIAWAMMEGIVAPAQGTETEARPSGD